MELDVLKELLKIQLENSSPFAKPGLLQHAMQQKAGNIVAKIKRSVIMETILAIIVSLVFLYFAYAYPSFSFRAYFGIFSCISIAFVASLFVLYIKLQRLQANAPVRQNLQDTKDIMKAYIKNYFRFCMILLPVCLCLAIFVFLFDFYTITPNQSLFTAYMLRHLWLPLCVCYCLFSAGMYFFTKFYLKKLYGEHITQLEKLLQELENEQ